MIRHVRLLLVFMLLLSLAPSAGSVYAQEMVAGNETVHTAISDTKDYYSYDSAVTEFQDYHKQRREAARTEAAILAALKVPEAAAYVVHAGDTLYKIALNFGSTVSILQDYNNIPDANTLMIGQKLMIPSVVQSVPLLDGREPIIEKVLSSTLTAYTAGKESTGKTPSHPQYGITYSGARAEEGRTVAVDPKVIPIGSTVYIEGIGIRKAEDTGSAIKGSKIDVFMNDVGEARTFGVKKNVKVFVLASA